MTQENLNLLPSRAKFRAKRLRIQARITTFLWIFVGVWLGIVILTMGAFLILSLVLKQTDKNYQSDLAQYKILLENMSVNQKVKYQAKIVGKVLESRFEYGDAIEGVSALFGDEVNVDNVQIKDKNNFIIDGSVIDGSSAVDFVEEKVDAINRGMVDGFKSATLSNISFKPDSGWLFRVEVIAE